MAVNMFIQFQNPDVPGSSSAPGHGGEIEVLSWNHGFAQPTSPTRSAGGGTVEQATHQNFTFSKYLDSASNALLKACWSGKQFGKATLRCYRSEGLYLTVVMEHVIIANVSIAGGPGDVPVENISLDYGIIQYEYKGQKHEDGLNVARHDLKTGIVG